VSVYLGVTLNTGSGMPVNDCYHYVGIEIFSKENAKILVQEWQRCGFWEKEGRFYPWHTVHSLKVWEEK